MTPHETKTLYVQEYQTNRLQKKGDTWYLFSSLFISLGLYIDPNVRLCFLLLWYPGYVSTPCVLSTPPPPPPLSLLLLAFRPFTEARKPPAPLPTTVNIVGSSRKTECGRFSALDSPRSGKVGNTERCDFGIIWSRASRNNMFRLYFTALTADEGTNARKLSHPPLF